MMWRDILNNLQCLHRLGILTPMHKELIRRIACMTNGRIKSQKCISIQKKLLEVSFKTEVCSCSSEACVRLSQTAQSEDRHLRVRQIAFMIHEYFQVTGAHEAVLDYSDPFRIT